MEPSVSKVKCPLIEGWSRHHSDPPPRPAAWLGSPSWRVAPVLSTVSLPLLPRNSLGVSNGSLGGAIGEEEPYQVRPSWETVFWAPKRYSSVTLTFQVPAEDSPQKNGVVKTTLV